MKKGEKFINILQKKFKVEEIHRQPEDQITILCDRNDLPEVVRMLYYDMGGWLVSMVANDERPINGYFALYYVLSMEGGKLYKGDELLQEEKCFIIVKTFIPSEDPSFPSVTPKVPAAVWYEREARDMFGLEPVGIPDSRRLVLPDDWPEDLYPLRKDSMDYRYRPEPYELDDEPQYDFLYPETENTIDVPLGPLHITSDEPGQFRLFVDGETIIDADYRLYYIHRGMEKLAENRMSYDQMGFLAERVCGICGFHHAIACLEGAERAASVEVPPRAQAIRTICLELERLHSHMLNIGLGCEVTGNITAFMHMFRAREIAMELAQLVTGGRKTYGMIMIGGVRRDIHDAKRKQMVELLDKLEVQIKECWEAIMDTNTPERWKGVGILDRKVARDFSAVGPNMRGSGFNRDTRYDHPFDWYKKVDFDVVVEDGCDVLSRFKVRYRELLEAISIIRQTLETMPFGPIMNDKAYVKPYAYAIGNNEAPRGENIHWTMHGNAQKVYRWRCRAATYNNWPSLRFQLRGNAVSDAALIVCSLDPCYSCTERITVVDVRKKRAKFVSLDDLKRYSITLKDSPLKDM